MFSLERTTSLGRLGVLQTAHGSIPSPFFMPVGTGGAMRGIGLDDLETLGAQILLCNTYHLHLMPGEDVVGNAGGLHDFIGWKKPMLTDSGGFQVFSLEGIRKISDKGVQFQSYRDGSTHFLGPEEAMRIQKKLGADIIMCFDECPPSTAPRAKQLEAVDRTLRWAAECRKWHKKLRSKQLLFGIVQGGLERDLRQKCAEELIAIGFDGYAIGGLAVGETPAEMYGILEAVCPVLPEDKPRYLMGVGRLEQIERAVALGIDMFDCVLPMREARHGTVYLSDGTRERFRKAEYLHDLSPIDPKSRSPLSQRHTKAYLSHLFRSGERSAERIACMQNIGVTLQFMADLRAKILGQ